MAEPIAPGEVWLVGAGPGDPELLTGKAERLIGEASVLFYDALVGPEVLDLARPGTRLVHVGKRSGRHSKDQKTIDRLIVEAPTPTGMIVFRALAPEPSLMPAAQATVAAGRCVIQPQPQ